MPDRPKSNPPAVAVPPTINPAAWESFPTFRETFLLWFTRPEFNGALRQVGTLVFDMAIEVARGPLLPDLPGSLTRAELAAAAGDLRHLQGFLTMVGQEQRDADGECESVRLSKLAAQLAVRIGTLAATLERAVKS